MKKTLILFSIAAATLVSSCKKGLDPELYGSLSTTSFPVTEKDFQSYVLEVYKPFQAKWGYGDPSGYQNDWFSPEYGDVMRNDYPSDICNIFIGYGGFFQQFSSASFTFLINQGKGSNHFEKIRFVSRITKIIDDVDKSSISTASKTLYTAEARMARGWCMYFLLQDYGPVPVILDPSKIGTDAENDLTRPSRTDYVAAIVSDLTYAAENLPKTPADYGRFNQAVALTVLMRTYMNEKDFVNAEKIGRKIMSMGYSLVNDYASLYKDATEVNSETMWAVTCTPDQDGGENHGSFNPWAFYTWPKDYPGENITASFAPGDAPFSCTWAFYDSFDANDKRRDLLIASYTNKNGGITNRASGLAGPVIAKYPDTGPSSVNVPQGNDQPKARLGEVMLYLAEAINQNNNGPTEEAIDLVNQVRAAHGGVTLGPVPASATANKATFDAWLLKEEGWETYFEGERRLDLIRHGAWQSALATVGKTAGPSLFPVPQYAITQSGGKLTPTPGY